jgi:hypothetical protein
MAAPYIDVSFKEKFNKDLHLEYTQKGSKFRNMCRTDGQVDGKTVYFQKLGTLVMGDKARNGEVPITNPAHNRVSATMVDKYVGVLIDQLDMSKLATEVKAGYISQMAQAAADYTDDLIIDALDAGATGSIGDYGSSDTDYIDQNMALEIGEYFDRRNVPRDGKRFCAVTPRQWAALMKIQSYSDADFVGNDLPFKKSGFEMRMWNDINWFISNRLNGVGTNQARCLAWHYSACGHGINSDYKIQWDWENLKQGWSGVASLSMGATVIDANGVVEIRLDDTGALPA